MERKFPYFIITTVLRISDDRTYYDVTGNGIEKLHLNDKLYDIQSVEYRIDALKQISSQDTASIFQSGKMRLVLCSEDHLPVFGRLLFLDEDDADTAAGRLDILGDVFKIVPFEEDFIFYGELEICRVTKDLVVKWSFLGRDIFVRSDDRPEPAFEMKTDRICLYDWLGSYYEIDYDGIVLLDRPPAVQAGKN